MKMGKAELCPLGTEITTIEECDNALQWAPRLCISVQDNKNLVAGSWNGTWAPPYQCAYQHQKNHAFHFNSENVQPYDTLNFVNGRYRMVCKICKCISFVDLYSVVIICLKI